MYRTPPDFGAWLTYRSETGRREFDGPAESTADAPTLRDSPAPLRRDDVDRIWQRATLVSRHERCRRDRLPHR